MALNTSGPISIAGTVTGQSIQIELDGNGTTQMSLNDAAVRTLAEVPSGQITMPTNFYGKANLFSFTISANQQDANLRTLALAAGWNGSSPVAATVNAGVFISSSSTSSPGLTVNGSWPGGVTLINNGFIVGRGGNGGSGGGSGGGGGAGVVNSSGGARGTWQGSANPGQPGTNTAGGAGGAQGGRGAVESPGGNSPTSGGSGGLALQVLVSLTITNNGTIGGGGGGGGGGGITVVNFPPIPGTFTVTNHAGGAGGALGAAGSAGTAGSALGPGAGGAAGNAITGNANITWVATGSRLGPIS